MGEVWDVNADAFPIVVTIGPQRLTSAGLERYRRDYVAILERGAPLVSVVDTRAHAGFMNSESRRLLAAFGEDTREARRGVVQAVVVLSEDLLQRASIRTMHWLSRPEQPVHHVKSEAEAITMALSTLAAAGIAPPSTEVISQAIERLRRARRPESS